MKRRYLIILFYLFYLMLTVIPVAVQAQGGVNLPAVGTAVELSDVYAPALIKGMVVYPDNPLKFDFIIDKGDAKLDQDELKVESDKLVKYFLSSMTVPKDDLWVNLSPHEKDRIIPDDLVKTPLGRDLLAQDYILKQLTATLIGDAYNSDELRVMSREENVDTVTHHTAPITPNYLVDSKIWIVPQSATVYEFENTVYITDCKLKVLTDVDHSLMMSGDEDDMKAGASPATTGVIADSVSRAVENEVNNGRNFAPLRQIFHSLILAKWYKQTVENSILSEVYVDKNMTAGIEIANTSTKQEIYAKYIEAYNKGVVNYIEEEYDPQAQEMVAKKYFSGGISDGAMKVESASYADLLKENSKVYIAEFKMSLAEDFAMSTEVANDKGIQKYVDLMGDIKTFKIDSMMTTKFYKIWEENFLPYSIDRDVLKKLPRNIRSTHRMYYRMLVVLLKLGFESKEGRFNYIPLMEEVFASKDDINLDMTLLSWLDFEREVSKRERFKSVFNKDFYERFFTKKNRFVDRIKFFRVLNIMLENAERSKNALTDVDANIFLKLFELDKAGRIEEHKSRFVFDYILTVNREGLPAVMYSSAVLVGLAGNFKPSEYNDVIKTYLMPTARAMKLGEYGGGIESVISRLNDPDSIIDKAMNGGIDFNEIVVAQEGAGKKIIFDSSSFAALINKDIKGLSPEMTTLYEVPSILLMLGGEE